MEDERYLTLPLHIAQSIGMGQVDDSIEELMNNTYNDFMQSDLARNMIASGADQEAINTIHFILEGIHYCVGHFLDLPIVVRLKNNIFLDKNTNLNINEVKSNVKNLFIDMTSLNYEAESDKGKIKLPGVFVSFTELNNIPMILLCIVSESNDRFSCTVYTILFDKETVNVYDKTGVVPDSGTLEDMLFNSIGVIKKIADDKINELDAYFFWK